MMPAALILASLFTYEADFTVRDDTDGCYQLDVERNTAFAHGHGWLQEGRAQYGVLVNGNRHFLATPKLSDFRMEMDCSLEPFIPAHRGKWNFDLGFLVDFRWDREARRGDELRVMWDPDFTFRVELNGREIARRENAAMPKLKDLKVVLSVKGRSAELVLDGERFALDLSDGKPGYIAFDTTFSSSSKLFVDRLALTSESAPEKTKLRDYRFELSRELGEAMPYVYDVSLWKYATGETELEAVLSGGVAQDRPRKETGGSEWGRRSERLTDPFLRIDSPDGEYRNIYFYNGMRQFRSPHLIRGKAGENPSWPVKTRAVFRDFPEDFSLAAGFGYFIDTPMRFVENGPWEQIRGRDGALLHEGKSVRGQHVAVKIVPPAGGAVAKALPKDLPRYDEAKAHAEKGGYFRESERIRFNVEAVFSAARWRKDEIRLTPCFADVYGEKLAKDAFEMKEISDETLAGGLRKLVYSVELRETPPVGVYKLFVAHTSPSGKDAKEVFIYEVLSDQPGGVPPPIASGLPHFFQMANETKYLEENAFDPWNPFAGIQHYYFCDNQYPLIGNDLQIWRALPFYNRGWWCWSWSRNTDKLDMEDDWNRDLVRHSRWFMGDARFQNSQNRWDLCVLSFYRGAQLELLREFVATEKPALKRLTTAKLDGYIAEKKSIEFEDLRDLFDTCWERWIAWVRPRIDERTQRFIDYLMDINPHVGLASYGPYAIYVARYKTAYVLKYCGYSIERDPRVRANDSFYVFEEYHHSCDYPIYRGSLFVASYDYYYDYGRRIYPEIYYSAWGRCEDGAVFQAHPGTQRYVRDTHQRKVAYQYAYGTPQFKNGAYKFWKDYGFHARNPDKQAMEEFVYAWGKINRFSPAKSAKAPFLMLDLDQISRHGDFFDDENNSKYPGGVEMGDVCNTAEEGLAYAYERAIEAGYTTPVVAKLDELDAITPEICDFAILPPIVKGTPKRHLDAIRRAYDRGVSLLCSEECVGLEDLFGVKKAAAVRRVGYVKGESFSHRLSQATYEPAGAEVMMKGAENVDSPLEIPLVFAKTGAKAKAVFINIPPACVLKNSFRNHYHWGSDSLSKTMTAGMARAFAYLAEAPSVKADRGTAMATYTEKGELVVVLSDYSPNYRDPERYPVSFRVTIREKGIGAKRIAADATYTVVSRTADELVLRVVTEKDTACQFVFR